MRWGFLHHRYDRFNVFIVIICNLFYLISVSHALSSIETFDAIVPRTVSSHRRHERQVNFQSTSSDKTPIPTPKVTRLPRISSLELGEIVGKAVVEIDKRLNSLEQRIFRNGIVLDPGSPSWFAAASAKTKVAAKNVSRMALVSEEASKLLLQQYKLSKDQVLHALPTVDIRGTALEKDCPFMVDFPCRPKKYRAYSGYCNNVQNPRWGNANTGYIRYLAPDYSNNVNNPRESISRQALPSALEVSRLVHSDSERPHPHLTVFLAIFAEFIFHDIFHTSQSAGYRGHRLRCCDVPSEFLHPECFPIIDNKSSRRPQLCVNYVRSSNVPRAGCTLGTREQINQVTSFIDGSVIYGSSEEEVKRLKANQNGLLKIQGHLQLLPPDTANPHDCRSTSTRKCFLAGDVRVNENIGLMVMHTIWVREHNRIAGKLAELNAQWTDEQLFEETRKIVGAELQHITYSELLPVLLGRQVLRQFDLEGQKEATFYQGYDINLNPGTSNAFAAAVGASFYSMMPSHFFRYVQSTGTNRDKTKAKHDTVGSMQIGETHFFPVPLYVDEAFDQFLLGMVNQKAQSMDEFITKEMNNNLVEETEGDRKNDEMDLAAWIIQQGRDHGIPGYIEWRKACRLSPSIQNFTTLSQIMTAEAAENIAKAYADVRDVDLFTGGLSEKPIVGGVVGPTFACILSRQFQHLKRADRFWYENDIPPNSFTKDQLQEIRKTSLARILCDNAGKLVRLLQPSPMLMPDEYLNAYQDCNNTAPALDLTKWKTKSPGYEVPKETLLTSLKEAMRQAIKRIAAEQEVFSRNIGVAPHTSAEAVHHVFLRPKRQAMFIANKSLVLELASLQLIHDVQLKDPEKKPSDLEVANMMLALSSQDVEDYIQLGIRENLPENLEGRCRFEEEHSSLPCDHTTPFRSASGWCNNIQNPQWGKSLVTFQRLLPPRYHDGISAPRSVGASGRDLPSPRLVSTIVHYAIAAPHARYTLALMQWGQFVDHDLTLTPMHEALGRRPLDCKSCDSAKTVHPECWPIPIPPDDPFFPSVHKNSSKNCISFARSLAGQLTLGRREQMNQLTSYLDASNMYGSDACEARMLRTSQGGRLNSTKHPFGGKDLLPLDVTNVECRAPSGVCFESGDIRASEQPGLTSMHTIWMREHNRIAAELERINPHWRDETIYQQARRIVSAMLQHITFTEFAPRVLGEKLMKESELFSSPYKYDPTCDASIFNEFAAAAYRFGHTLLKPAFPRIGSKYEGNSGKVPLQLRTVFFNPEPLYERNAIDEILRGLLSTSVEVFDHSITSEVTNHLFEDRKVPFSGMDLVSLNLQRGRDHGLQGYNAYRVLCNKTRATTFEDLLEDIPQHIVQRLKSVYENVDDIDLFTGGVSETPMYGALVGPTFGCIISMQFNNLKKCDRFWYETQDPFLRFTDDQLAEIRQTKISKVICDNADSIDTVQMMGFELPDDFLNPRMSCKSLPSINLRLWKETNSCNYEVQSNDIVSIPTGHTHRISPCITCSCTKEGMVCQSMKISNCFQLASTYTRERILEDDVCKVQCAFAFRTYPQFESSVNNVLGFTISNN